MAEITFDHMAVGRRCESGTRNLLADRGELSVGLVDLRLDDDRLGALVPGKRAVNPISLTLVAAQSPDRHPPNKLASLAITPSRAFHSTIGRSVFISFRGS